MIIYITRRQKGVVAPEQLGSSAGCAPTATLLQRGVATRATSATATCPAAAAQWRLRGCRPFRGLGELSHLRVRGLCAFIHSLTLPLCCVVYGWPAHHAVPGSSSTASGRAVEPAISTEGTPFHFIFFGARFRSKLLTARTAAHQPAANRSEPRGPR